MELMEYINNNVHAEIVGIIGTFRFANSLNLEEVVEVYLSKIASLDKIKKALLVVSFPEKLFKEQICNLSVSNYNKLCVAVSLLNNKDTHVFYNIDKGLNHKEVQNVKRILKALCENGKRIILFSNDITFLFNFAKRLFIVNNNEVINDIKEINWFLEDIYNYVSKPPIIDFVMNLKKRNIKIDNCVETKELLKAIYRSVS